MTGAFRGLDACVHCGFCLQSCPTFLVTGDEADSPRGRIVLMQRLETGELPANDRNVVTHLDRCLGCRACEPACPSGVRYGPALEAARQRLTIARPVPLAARVVHTVMAEPALRRPLLAIARAVRPLASRLAGSSTVAFGMGMLAATKPLDDGSDARKRWRRRGATPAVAPASPSTTASVFKGCIMDGLFGHVHAATERVLRAHGWDVQSVSGAGCCGALHAHAGQHDAAVALARANVEAYAGARSHTIVVNSAGCGALLKDYDRLLSGDPDAAALAARVRDVTEVLAESGPREGGRLSLRVAYDPPCHLLHAQGVADAPHKILNAIPGLTLVEHEDAELCCGSAGSYSLTERTLSRSILDRKIAALTAAAPDVVATGNPGCAMQIGAGLIAVGYSAPVLHPVELLDRSYRRAGYYD